MKYENPKFLTHGPLLEWMHGRQIVRFAFRYALSRHSRAVDTTIEFIEALWPQLGADDRREIHNEIRERLDRAAHSGRAPEAAISLAWTRVLTLPVEAGTPTVAVAPPAGLGAASSASMH